MKVAQQLCVTFSDDNVSNWTVRLWAVIQGSTLRDWLQENWGW